MNNIFNQLWSFFTNLVYVMRDCGSILTWGIKGTPFNVLGLISVGGFTFLLGWKIYHLLNPLA